ncbi:MAG: hypothetical protein IJT69_00615 [Clostridia bacterium]|nr:hypothetical protein [Clostridia bacterium]
MMRRKVWLLVIGVILLVCALCTFAACESYKATALDKVGDKNAVVASNGGLVVKQGDYLYFINGYTDYLTANAKDNWFGTPVKGAIVRVSYHADGTLGDDYVVVVPKSVMASSENVGISIFGEWIYYVSPSAETDRSGTVQTDTLQFMRTKIDGTDTQVIVEIDDTSVKYKYTQSAFVWFDSSDNKLYSKDLTAKKFKKSDKGDCIAEDVASVHFIKNETYDPAATGTPVADYVLYTKNSELSYESTNTLYAIAPRGGEAKTLIDADTFSDGKYSISVLASSVEENALAIYYTKTEYVGTSSSGTVVGTYAYRFAAGTDFVFTASNEKQLSTSDLSSITPISYAEGVVKTGSNTAIYHTDGTPVSTFGELSVGTLLAVENGAFYYLDSDGKMLYYPLDNLSNAHYAYTTGEKAMTSFTGAEYFDGYFYFIQDDEYDYMARVKLADIDVYSGKDAAVTRVAKVTAADQEKMDEAEAEDDD